MPRCSIVVAGLLACMWHAAPLVFAQGYPTELVGTVRDDNGRPARGVPVVVEDERGVTRATVKTDPQGFYLVSGLMPGCYVLIIADYPEFAPQRRVAIIAQNFATTVNVTLEMRLAEVQQVTVDIDALLGSLGTWDSSVGLRFTRQGIESSPLTHGRNLQSFLDTVPGIVFSETRGNGAQFTAVGQRRFSNRLTIDQMNADLGITTRATDLSNLSGALPAVGTTGGTQTLVPLAAIEEIQLRTSNATPEYARTPGAQISVITRAGSDVFHGDLNTQVRPDRLGASSWITNAGPAYFGLDVEGTKRPTSYRNLAGSAGGPLWPKRLTVFGAWESQAIARAVSTTSDTPSLSFREAAAGPFRDVLNAYPLPNGPETGRGLASVAYTLPNRSDVSVLSLRVDGQLSSGHHAFGRVNVGRSGGSFWDPVNKFPFPSTDYREATSLTTATVGVASAGPRILHDIRVNVSAHTARAFAGRGTFGDARTLPLEYFSPPGVTVDSVWMSLALFPGLAGRIFSGDANYSRQHQLQILDVLTISRAHVDWRFGVDYRRMDSDSIPAPNRYLYRFASLSSFMQGRPASVLRDYLSPVHVRSHVLAAFLQTTYRASANLSVEIGGRYTLSPAPRSQTGMEPLLFRADELPELHPVPAGTPLFETAWFDLAPRVAATYRRRSWIARVAAGVVYDERASPVSRAYGDGYPFTAARFDPARFPVSPDDPGYVRPAFGEPGSLGNAYAAPLTYRTPRTYQWDVGVERELPHAQRIALTYVGTSGRALPYWTMEYFPGSTSHQIHTYTSDGTSDYNALLVSYLRSRPDGASWGLAYTWSHALDLDSGEGVEPNPPTRYAAPSTNRASADFDRRHVLRATASYQFPAASRRWLEPLAGWKLDAMMQIVSGAAVTVSGLFDAGFGVYTLRPDLVLEQPTWLDDPASPTGQRISPAAFSRPGQRLGNLGRNTMRGPFLRQLDLSLSRAWKMPGGRATLSVRCDAFNALNVPNVGPPDGNLDSAMFGLPYQTYAEALGTGTLSQGGLVPLEQSGAPRSIQFGARITW